MSKTRWSITAALAALLLLVPGCSDNAEDGNVDPPDAAPVEVDAGDVEPVEVLNRASRSSMIAVSNDDSLVAMVNPDDGIASYQWAQTGGASVTLSSATAAQPTFTAPNVGPGGVSLTFQLTVTDTGGLQSTDTCVVSVS